MVLVRIAEELVKGLRRRRGRRLPRRSRRRARSVEPSVGQQSRRSGGAQAQGELDAELRRTRHAGAYNKVGVLKIGPSSAKNVLVLEPGTSAGSAYFVPLAKWIVSKTPGWQVWSVERRRTCSRTNRS